MDKLEQNTRQDDLLITGLDIEHWTYVSVAANVNTTEDPAQEELLILEYKVVIFYIKNIDSNHVDIYL